MHLIFTLPSQIHVKPGRIIIYSNGAMRSKCALRRLFDNVKIYLFNNRYCYRVIYVNNNNVY